MVSVFADPLAVQLGYHVVKLDTPEVLDWYEVTLGRQIHIELWYYIADRNGKPASRNHDTEVNAWEHFYREQWELELELIRDKMRGLTEQDDKEIAHGAEDKLLVHALETITEALDDDNEKVLIAEIIEAYRTIKLPAVLKVGKRKFKRVAKE